MELFDEDMVEVSVPSTVLESFRNINLNESKPNWHSIKEAFLKTVSSETGPFSSFADHDPPTFVRRLYHDNHLAEEVNLETKKIRQHIEDDFRRSCRGDIVTVEKFIRQLHHDKHLTEEVDLEIEKTREHIEDDFCQRYAGDVVTVDSNDTAMDLGSSSDDIFRVWDLGIPDMKDEFTTELGSAFVHVPPLMIQPRSDDATAWKENLVVAVADLSLEENSRRFICPNIE